MYGTYLEQAKIVSGLDAQEGGPGEVRKDSEDLWNGKIVQKR